MMNLPMQRERPDGSVQNDLRYEKFEAAFHKWLREVALFIVHFFGQNGEAQEEQKA